MKPAHLFLAALILAASGKCAEPPLNITNCVRPEGKECASPFTRQEYPAVFVTYLFEEAKAVFAQRASGKLRVRHPEEVSYRFDLGDLSISYEKVRYGRTAKLSKRLDAEMNLSITVESEEQFVKLPGWISDKDYSAKLFVAGWLNIWNDQLVEPFPATCVDNYIRRALCKREQTLSGMVAMAVVNAKAHMGKTRATADNPNGFNGDRYA